MYMAADPPTASIVRLQSDVVARIAAGEVLQRPASALKELLDNAVDAGASQIGVIVGDAGAKMLQVQDNGTGIQASDMPLLCARHATSKLRCFEDLGGVGTLGFRGEAMASISHVAHITVTSLAAGHSHGMRATFRDGALTDCQPCAASQGTTVLVEDLFYNCPARQKSLSASGAEYAHMLHVVSRYAVFHTSVGFSIRRVGRHPDLQTPAGSSQLELISKVFGANVRGAMAPFHSCHGDEDWLNSGRGPGVPQDALVFVARGFINVRGQNARSTLVLRVNQRIVQWPALKRALVAAFGAASASCLPFVILDVQLPNAHVDVNLHPTKAEVAILHEDAVIDGICISVQDALKHHHETRAVKSHRSTGHSEGQLSATRVRTDRAAQTIASFACGPEVDVGSHALGVGKRPQCHSGTMGDAAASDVDQGLVDVLRRHVPVGFFGHWWLLQHGADLYMLDLCTVARKLAHQQAVLVSGQLPRIQLHPQPHIETVLGAARLANFKFDTQDVQDASKTLMEHTDVVRDNFGVDISTCGYLCALPDLLCGILPNKQRMPAFLAELSSCLPWRKGQPRAAIAEVLAKLYELPQGATTDVQAIVHLAERAWKPRKTSASQAVLVRVASLSDLYKTFERC